LETIILLFELEMMLFSSYNERDRERERSRGIFGVYFSILGPSNLK
jgi:hypothetical protein